MAVTYGLNLLATPYIVVRLGLHDFGIWAMTGAMAQYAGLFDLGASRAANRFVALFHARGETDKERSAVGICVAFVLALGALLFTVAVLGAGITETVLRTGDSQLVRLLLLCSATVLVCGLLARVLAAASFGRGRYLPPNIGLAIMGAAQLVGGVTALAFSPSLRNFALGTAVGAFFGLCSVVGAILLDERRILIGLPRVDMVREIAVFGVHSQVAGAADVVLYQSGKLIAGIVIGPAAAGAYDLGIRLIQGVQAFAGAAAVAINTHLTRAYASLGMAGVRAQYSQLTRRNAAVAIFLPTLLGATALSVVPLWLGEREHMVMLIATALTLGVTINVSTAVCSALLHAIGRPGLAGIEGATFAAVSVLLAVPLAMAFGYVGLIAGYACWMALGNLLGVWWLQSRVGISMTDFLNAIAGPFGVALAAAVAATPISLIMAPDSRIGAIVPFLLSSFVFCAVYGALGWRLGYLPRLRGDAQKPPTVLLSGTEGHDGTR